MTRRKELHCSFCGKSKRLVDLLITGPSVAICDQCITCCNEIIADRDKKRAKRKT